MKCTDLCTEIKTTKGVFMAEPFIICSRPSQKKSAKISDCYYFAWYRDPQTGAKLPQNRFSIDTLAVRLKAGGIRGHVKSKAEAFRIAQEALDKGLVFDYQKPVTPRLIPFIEAYWDYSGSYVKKKLAEGYSITKNYVQIMRMTFDKHVRPYIPEGLALDGFSVPVMEKIKAKLYDSGVSTSTIGRVVLSVKKPLTEAYRNELISDNIGERLSTVRRINQEKGILSSTESKALIQSLKGKYNNGYERWKYLVPALCYYTGMRNSEIISITPSCIEEFVGLDYSLLHVDRAYNRIDGFKLPKNGKKRLVTIPSELARELIDYSDKSPDSLIFYSLRDKTRPLDEKAISENFREALEEIGISRDVQAERNLSFYSLRHGFNSTMVDSGLSEVQIRGVTGHSSYAMLEHYRHETAENLKAQAEARNRVLPFIEVEQP